jgi:ankyrin repeat protein
MNAAALLPPWLVGLRARLSARPALRERLELALGAIVTGALVIGLSTAIHPTPKADPGAEAHVVAPGDLAEANADPTKASSALVQAVRAGNLALLKSRYTPGARIEGLLGIAAARGDRPITEWLLAQGADVHEDEGNVNAPIVVADDHPEIVRLLRRAGAADPSLTLAATAGAENHVARLLANGSSPNDPSTLLVAEALAAPKPFATRRRIVDLLLSHGADVVAVPKSSGDALAAAANACQGGESRPTSEQCLALIELLVARGAHATGDALAAALGLDDPLRPKVLAAMLAAPLEPGAPSVALAHASAPADLVQVLVERGVDWAWHDGEDDAALPLIAAVERGDRDTVRALLDAGAPVGRVYKTIQTALSVALDGLQRGPEYARIVELLVERGASATRRLPDGRMPLFAAAESGDIRAVTFLLDHGANPNDRVIDDTALDAAERASMLPAARVIHARGGRRGAHPISDYR